MSPSRCLIALGLGWFAALAWAAPITVSLVLGDLDSVTAVEAVRALRADPAMKDVRFAVYPNAALTDGDLSALRASRLVFVQTVGRGLAVRIAPELRALAERGARAYAVGRTWDADFAQMGLVQDRALAAYVEAGGAANIAAMVRAALHRDLRLGRPPPPPAPLPEMGFFEPASARSVETFDEYRRLYDERAGAPWVAIMFYRANVLSGQTATVRALCDELRRRGLNALPVFGYPNEALVERFLLDADGTPRVRAVIALSVKVGVTPDRAIPAFGKLGVPVINAITLASQSREQWEASPIGLDITERSWQVAGAELAGAIAPTVVAAKERRRDAATGLDMVVETPIPDRVERIAERAWRWIALGETPARARRVAIVYFNYPPGRESIGASYLNVLPRSLWRILERLREEGYRADGAPADEQALFVAIRDHGANLGRWEPGAIAALARSGHAVLWPVAQYRKYFDRLPTELRESMRKAWGPPESSAIGTWRDAGGTPYFIFPARRWGSLVFAPQPSRGWEQDVRKLYHDVTLPPHHQYLAFYLWLQHEFRAQAMVHVGTHATHEWHGGKEVGFTAADPGEVFVGAVPQLYPYIVDDVGEALQAKRRGMATIVSHLTPPMDVSGLDPELKELAGLISDYGVAKEKGTLAPQAILADIAARAAKKGLLGDLGIGTVDDASVDRVDDYLREIGEKRSPYGLHTFGTSPDAEKRRRTAEAVVSTDTGLSVDERAARQADVEAALERSGAAELDALVAGLAGRYVAAGPGNDPIRNPASLPTGRNLYGFDPGRLPTPATYAAGARLAEELVASYRQRHGRWPKKLVFNLWGVESSRHEGVMEGEIMALLGVHPVWDGRGRVAGVAPIPRAEMARPRVDVTIVPSGLYRDLFAPLMKLLDEAASVARQAGEPDNPIPVHVAATRAALVAQGTSAEQAERLAGVRLFSVPSGAYGTNLDKVVPLSNTWSTEKDVADVYFMRMSHAYGQGWWGGRVVRDGRVTEEMAPALGVDLLKFALKDADAAVHSRSSNLYGTLDNDDFYQYLGGTAMAIRQVNGKTPEVLVADLSNPANARTETLEKYMGREMHSRYLNPKWIDAMLAEGYSGARFVARTVEHLWGWTVTTPDRIDDAKWQQMYETYVADKHGLRIRERFREAGNMLAYQALVDRMLVAVNKGYWKAAPETVAGLENANASTIAEAGVACYADTCSSPSVAAMASAQDARGAPAQVKSRGPRAQRSAQSVAAPVSSRAKPAKPAKPARPDATHAQAPTGKVSGYAMEETRLRAPAPVRATESWIAVLILAMILAGAGARHWALRAPTGARGQA